jgi:hypothetical protein
MIESSDHVWTLSRHDFSKRGAVEIDVVLGREPLARPTSTAQKTLEVGGVIPDTHKSLSRLVSRRHPHESGAPAARDGWGILERNDAFDA